MTRLETDLLGELLLPDDALYGIQTQRAINNFPVSGQPVHHRLIRAGAMVKLACAKANLECGYLEQPVADAITAACHAVISGAHPEAFPVDALQGGAGTSTNMNWNEVIAHLAGKTFGLTISPHEHVNLHQSTNDVFPTAVRIAAIQGFASLEASVVNLLETLQEKERQFADVVKLGRTQLRDAVPTTLGREFGAYATAIGRDRWRLSKCVERLRVVNLGGTAIGTGITAPRKNIFCAIEKLREVTGLNLSRAENMIDSTMNNDVFSEVSGIMRAHAATLSKIARDLRLLSSGPNGGLGEIELPALQPGSSIMPGKVNPVIPEMVMQVSFRVMAYDSEINQVAMNGELELNAFLPLLADALLNAQGLLTNADTLLAETCISGITANPRHCRELLESSAEIATALIPAIGHDRAVTLAQHMRTHGLNVREAVLQLGLLDEERLENLLQPEALCALGWR